VVGWEVYCGVGWEDGEVIVGGFGVVNARMVVASCYKIRGTRSRSRLIVLGWFSAVRAAE